MKTLLIVVIAVVVCAAGIFALHKWPQPEDRERGLRVLAGVKKARRLYQKALSTLSKSAFEVRAGGQRKCATCAHTASVAEGAPEPVCPRCRTRMLRVPETVIFRDESQRRCPKCEHSLSLKQGAEDPPPCPKCSTKMRPVPPLDDKALDILKGAQDELSEVLSKNANAEKGALALGHATVGRILSLRAKVHAETAAKAWQSARDLRNKVYGAAATMGAQGVRARFFERLAGLTTDAVAAEAAKAKKRQDDLQTQIQKIDTEVQALEKTRKGLLDANAKLAKEAEQLNTASQLATKAQEGLDKFEEAQVKEKQVTKGRLEIDKIEKQIRNLKAKRADLAIQLRNAAARVAVAEAVIKDRTKLKGEQQAKVNEDKNKLAKTQSDIEALAAEALLSCKAAARACERAFPLYQQAEKSLEQSVNHQPAQPKRRKAEALAAQGDLLMAWAQLYARRLANHQENDLCVGDLQKVWVDATDLSAGAPGSSQPATLPEGLRELRGFLKQSGQVRDTAKAKYTRAVEVYEQAMNMMVSERALAWAYQGQLARAYLRLYQLSGNTDTASLAEAKTLLDAAVKDRERSPFLKHLVAERKSLP